MEMIKAGNAAPDDENSSTIVSVTTISTPNCTSNSTNTSPHGRTPLPPSSENDSPIALRSGKSVLQLNDSIEKRPGSLLRAPSRRSSKEKSRSMTDVEITADYISSLEVLQLNERLRTEEPPKSLDEARQEARERRASIKEERKASIEFIRNRTSSRAAQMGLPPPSVQEGIPLELLEKGKLKTLLPEQNI